MSAPALALDPPPAAPAKRRKTPTILQQEATECGSVALGIVLAHYGRWVPVEELRTTCGVSRDGSRASNILKAARTYGLEATGRRIDVLRDLDHVVLPAIAYWEFSHFVVIEGYDAKHVYLNDPALGPRPVTWDEFDAKFTGVLLELSPGESFVADGVRESSLRGLTERFRSGTSAIVLCVLAGFGLLVPGLLVPAGVRIFVDEYLGAGDRHWLWLVVVGVALAAVVQFALTYLQQITLLRLSTRLSLSMSTRFFEHLLRLPTAFFVQRYAGQVVTRVQTNDHFASILSSELAASLLGLLTSALFLVLMAIYDWQLTIVALAFALGNVVALRAGARAQRDVARRLVSDSGKLVATAVGGLENIETLKATSEEAAFFGRWTGMHAKLIEETQSLGGRSATLATVPLLLAGLNTAVLLGFGGWQVMTDQITLGTLVAFQLLAAGFNAPIGRLVGFGETINQLAGSLASVDDVLRYPEQPVPTGEGLTTGKLSGRLEIDDVTFGYNPLEPPLIEDFSLRIEPGQRIAIVGTSGSGRSTLSRLVAGLTAPWSGEIRLDGIPRDELPPALLASTLAFVDQDIRLFEGTVRDNITLWDATIPDEAVTRAARDAEIHDDIVRRVGGYERQLEEGGRDWSGGQRQRLEIARALAGDPALLVLDEATSALDPLVEYEIDKHLRARGCACLIVAHRLSTIRDCDEIIVLDHGRVVERGTHDELVQLRGQYFGLVGE